MHIDWESCTGTDGRTRYRGRMMPDETVYIPPVRFVEPKVYEGSHTPRAKRKKAARLTALAVVASILAFLIFWASFGFALLNLPYNR